MSGPKVVRIVTREEVEAICRDHLRQVDDAIEAFRRVARRHDALGAELEKGLVNRRRQLLDLLAAERWMDVQKRAPETVAFLNAETDRVRDAALAASAAARSKRRRLVDGARSLIAALDAAGRPVGPELRDVVRTAMTADERSLGAMQATLTDALAQLVPAPAVSSGAQHALAARLRVGETAKSLDDWLASMPVAEDARDGRLDALLSELEAASEREPARAFLDRASAIAQETSRERRALLTDSLTLDVARHMREVREAELAMARLRDVRSLLATLTSQTAQDLGVAVATALEAGDVGAAESLVARAREVADAERREIAASARRRAVLGGLAALGYEVRETMQATWARDGRLVVRKAGSGDYGVELAAPADVARLQVRLVGSDRPATPRDAVRDRDQETVWCGQFDQLSALLAQAGGDVILERGLAAGAQPVKTVPFEQVNSEAREVERVPASRALR